MKMPIATKQDIINNKFEKERKMKLLISAAMERMDSDDLLELMYEKCCNKTQKEYLQDKMRDIILMEGEFIIKFDSLQQKSKVEDFLSTEIFPYYNELESHLFSY